MKVRDAIKLIEDDGWILVATRGSHRQFKHPRKAGRVTITGNRRMTWPQAQINMQAALKAEET